MADEPADPYVPRLVGLRGFWYVVPLIVPLLALGWAMGDTRRWALLIVGVAALTAISLPLGRLTAGMFEPERAAGACSVTAVDEAARRRPRVALATLLVAALLAGWGWLAVVSYQALDGPTAIAR